MSSRLACPGCRGELEAVEVGVEGGGPPVDQRVTLRYLCHGCGAHVTRRMDPLATETVEHVVPGRPGPDPVAAGVPAASGHPDVRAAVLLSARDEGGSAGHAGSGASGGVGSGVALVSLTYMSTAVDSFDRPALHVLLEESRQYNHAAGLTGMLLFDGAHFIQTLEGPAGAVDATFARIGADVRHRDLVVALRDDIDVRLFGDWTMGFDVLLQQEVADVEGFNDFMSAGPEQQTANLLGRAGVFHRLFRDRMR